MTWTNIHQVARKFLVALLAAGGIVAASISDGKISPSEAITIVIAFVSAFGVYQVPNDPIPGV